MMPAVIVNQIAAKTGAVVRNFFMETGRDGAIRRKGIGNIQDPLRTAVSGRDRGGLAHRLWMDRLGRIQRGETVTLLSDSSSLPLVNSPKAARGQVAAASVLLNARARSIWISLVVASLLPRMACR